MPRKFDSAVEQLRHLANWSANWNDSWNTQWSQKELIKLHTFHMSEQSDYIDEMIDRWPNWLIKAVLKLPLGGQLDNKTYERAKALEL